jgi:hypothetical protein
MIPTDLIVFFGILLTALNVMDHRSEHFVAKEKKRGLEKEEEQN